MKPLVEWTRIPLMILGVFLVLVAERYLPGESYTNGLLWGGFGLTLLATLQPFLMSVTVASSEEAKSWRVIGLWQVLVVVGLGLYFVYKAKIGTTGTVKDFGDKALLAGWAGLLMIGGVAGLGVEFAFQSIGRGQMAEASRLVRSFLGWSAVGMLLVSVAAINYGAFKTNKTYDLSYLKTTTPSESTINMLKSLTEDMEVALFYPETNEVRSQVEPYFRTLSQKEPRLKLSFFDKDMRPTTAEELKVSRNGIISLKYGTKKARIDTGDNLGSARSKLRKLDAEFQKKFLELTAKKKTAYFTRGHGEASWSATSGERSREKFLRGIEQILRSQNYNLRQFGVAEGSATDVPDEVDVVVVAGPTRPFQQEEVDALLRFLRRGGSVMLFLDSGKADDTSAEVVLEEEGQPLLTMLEKEVGITYDPTPMANEKDHINANRGQADRWFLYTNIFTSHESVSRLSRHEERINLMLLRTGHLTVKPEFNGWKNFETVRSLANSFVDKNKNFTFDKDSEKKDTYTLGAVGKKEFKGEDGAARTGHIFVFADSTMITDLLIQMPVHQVFFFESLKWLVGDTDFGGELSSEEDVKIIHSKKENNFLFFGMIVVMPLFVLGIGFLGTMGGRRKARGQ